ncbi:MAG: hypothetical protein AYK18_13560 [Theionarchaea archaeon DG-70]|nr:MAG: hypothetical protein AYK18_13560 [Theionarchaea archaeon DG-70]
MKTNLLRAIEFPEKMNVVEVEIDYVTAINILKDSNVFFHFESKNIYFFGDKKGVSKILENKGYGHKILSPIYIDVDCIQQYWEILRVLFYRATGRFLLKKGLYFHPERGNTFYVVRTDSFKEIPLIREKKEYGYYIHEGFEYKLHLINENVFLSLMPLIVLTRDKKSSIISDEKDSGIYTREGYKRWNSVTRNMLDTWAAFLGNEKKIRVSIPNGNDLIFETEFSEAGGGIITKDVKQTMKTKKIRQVSLDEYW